MYRGNVVIAVVLEASFVTQNVLLSDDVTPAVVLVNGRYAVGIFGNLNRVVGIVIKRFHFPFKN